MLKRVAAPILVAIVGVLANAVPALAEPAFTPSSSTLDFGAVDVHFGGSPHQSVQFTNTTESPILVKAVTISGPDATHFQVVSDGCSGQTLLPTPGGCTVEVSFEPGSPVSRSATLEILGDEEQGTVALSGEGITGTLSATPGPPTFAPIPYSRPHSEGESNETVQTNIVNSGSAGTLAEKVEITGPDAASFSIAYGNCENNLLSSGNQCGMGIRFEPTSPGPKHAQLVITNDSTSGPLVVPLDGEGLLGPKISMSTYQALLGQVQVGSAVTQTFTMTNTGDYPLGVQQAFLISGTPLMFPVVSDTCSRQIIYPGTSCAVIVEFRPTTVGEKDASILFITSNAVSLNVVGIDGVGFEPTSTPAPAKTPPAPRHRSRFFAGHPAAHVHPGRGHRLDTGIRVGCPVTVRSCVVESFIREAGPAKATRRASRSKGGATSILGAASIRLRGGTSARVHIHLTQSSVSRLRRGERLPALIGLVVHTGGTVLAARTDPVALSLKGA